MNKIISTTTAVLCLGSHFLSAEGYDEKKVIHKNEATKAVILDQEGHPKAFVLRTSKRDRLYWGPDFFWTNEASHIQGIKIRDRAMYYGLKAGYDFLRPHSLYAGFNALYALGRMHIKAHHNKVNIYKDHTRGAFANGELRLGYNFNGEEPVYLTPFVGLGFYHTRPTRSIHYIQNWLYGAVGMKLEFEVNPTFNMGLNLKGMRALYLEQRIKKHKHVASSHRSSNALGYEVSLPLTVRMGQANDWDLRIEPYYLKLNSYNNANVVGGQLTFSMRY